LWDVQVLDAPTSPLWLRGRGAVAGDGGVVLMGPPSPLSNAVFEVCPKEAYLSTQFAALGRWALVQCRACPEGALCEGGVWEALGNQAGWARVPWSNHGLSFRKCASPLACPANKLPAFSIASVAYLDRLPALILPSDQDNTQRQLVTPGIVTTKHPPFFFSSTTVESFSEEPEFSKYGCQKYKQSDSMRFRF
jgi:hypothetical protein